MQIASLLPKDKIEYFCGFEYVTEYKPKDKEMWEIYLDYKISPGYFSWIAPINSNLSHIGLGKRIDKIPIQKSMSTFLKKRMIKIKKRGIRVGASPLSGTIKKTYGNRFITIGDAAGQIGSLSFAGINYNVRASKIASTIIEKIIDEPTEKNLKLYEDTWKSQFSSLFRTEKFGRKIYDRIDSNEKLEVLLEIISTIEKRKIYKLFERFTKFKPMHLRRTIASDALKFSNLRRIIPLLI